MQFVNDLYETVPGHAADPALGSTLLYEGTVFNQVTTPVVVEATGAGTIYAPLASTVASTNAACQAALGRACVANAATPQTGTFPLDQAVLTGEFADYVAAGLRAATSTGVAGWRDDDLAFTRDWGFPLGQGAPVAVATGATEDAAAGRPARPCDTTVTGPGTLNPLWARFAFAFSAAVLDNDVNPGDAIAWTLVATRVLMPLGFLIALLQAERFAARTAVNLLQRLATVLCLAHSPLRTVGR